MRDVGWGTGILADGTARSIRVGLIGTGIGASRTPAMHVERGRLNGFDYRYDLIDLSVMGLGVEALPRLLDEAERDGFAGLNITHPCKQVATQFVDELSSDSAVLGAINTITFQNGRRIGHNTDWWGFAQGFRRSRMQRWTGRFSWGLAGQGWPWRMRWRRWAPARFLCQTWTQGGLWR